MDVKDPSNERAAIIHEIQLHLMFKNLKSANMADQLGIKRPTVFAWMAGRNWPSQKDRNRIADFLGINRTDLYTREELNELAEYRKRFEEKDLQAKAAKDPVTDVAHSEASLVSELAKLLGTEFDKLNGLPLSFSGLKVHRSRDESYQSDRFYFYDPNDKSPNPVSKFVIFIPSMSLHRVFFIDYDAEKDLYNLRFDKKGSLTITLSSSEFVILGRVRKALKLTDYDQEPAPVALEMNHPESDVT